MKIGTAHNIFCHASVNVHVFVRAVTLTVSFSAGHHHVDHESLGYRAAGIPAPLCHEATSPTHWGGVLVTPRHHHVPGTAVS